MSNEPAEKQDTAVVMNQSDNVMQAIVAAAQNPNIDPDKMERMMALYERMEAKKAEMAFSSSFSAMQDELPEITEGGAIRHSGKLISQYARWDEDINPVIKPILSRHGFALSFRIDTKDGVNVEGVLSHREGHSEKTTITLPADTGGAKNAVQAVASSVSYGKRYTAGALLNLTTGGQDDDGQKAAAPTPIDDDQAANIQALIDEVGADKAKFISYLENFGKCSIGDIEHIPAKMYKTAIAALEGKRKKK